MRRGLLALLVLAPALAGCLQGLDADAPPAEGAAAAGFALECSVAGNWSETCLALASPNESPSKTEIDLAVNPNDPNHVVVGSKDLDPLASDCVWAVAQVTKDGGRTWRTSYIGGEMASRMPGDALWGWQCITDPIMVFDGSGALYYGLQLYDHTLRGSQVPRPVADALPLGATIGSSIVLARSLDGGETWDKFTTLHAGDGSGIFHDYMRMAWNPATGSVYTIWNQFTGVAVVPVLVATRDGGETAAPPVYIPVPEQAGNVVMSGLAVGPDGTVFVMLDDGAGAYFTLSRDDARSFSAPVKVASYEPVPRMMKNNSYRTGGGFELAADTSGGERDGWLYATFADYSDEDADIMVIRSEDGGATWSEPVQVNGGEFARGDQWMERPTVDADGNLHLVYLDRSRDESNYGVDATWAVSSDGGATWSLKRLTRTPFDASLGIHQDGSPFIGDYIGIGSAGRWLYMGFPTTVTGRAEIAVAKVHLGPADS